MSKNTNSKDELAVASALLNFGFKGPASGGSVGRQQPVVAAVPHQQDHHHQGDASTVGDDSKSYAVVTVGSTNSSDDTLSEKDAGTKKRSSVDLAVLAPAPSKQSSTSGKRQRSEVAATTAAVKDGANQKEEYVIQDCHAVLGDRHCAGRTTIATVIMREIKIKYKEKYKGKGVDNWYDEAMVEYYQLVKEKVPGFTQDDYETVLVYSYSPAKGKDKKRKSVPDAEIGSNRIEKPNCYKYHTDDFPKYGKANVPEAVKFFFNSKDAPTLPKEISKYRSDFEKLKTGGGKQPPREKMQFFEDFLKFCEDNLHKAKDEEMAQQLLHSLNLIPTLRRLWDTLKAASATQTKGGPTTSVAKAVLKAKEPSLPKKKQQEQPRAPQTSSVPVVPKGTAAAQLVQPENAVEARASSIRHL